MDGDVGAAGPQRRTAADVDARDAHVLSSMVHRAAMQVAVKAATSRRSPDARSEVAEADVMAFSQLMSEARLERQAAAKLLAMTPVKASTLRIGTSTLIHRISRDV